MSVRKPTPEQQAAIDAAGEVLVSASAGSGKTFVMVEKIISLILSEKAEVSSVLAVTFTNLAASEMKERLRAALVARLNSEKDAAVRARLRAQLGEVATADICTVHAFCTSVIRRYFYETDAPGNFRILDEAETDKLRGRAVDAAFDRLLAQKSPLFAGLCAAFADSRGFDNLKDVLLKSYETVIVKPDPRAFLESVPALYGEEGFARVSRELLAPALETAGKLKERCAALSEKTQPFLAGGLFGEGHKKFLGERTALADAVLGADGLFSAVSAAEAAELTRKPDARKINKSGDAAALALDAEYAALKETVDRLIKQLSGYGSEEEERSAFYASGETAKGIAELLLVYDEEFSALKRRAGALDFSDLEHYCLALLRKPQVREEVAGRYTHIFVDEYQDVNPAQEEILSLVSGRNVFMVGDVKQSIYGFRGCSASFFSEKFARLSQAGGALTLNGNFRSCTAVLDFVNDVFSQVMTPAVCSVDYAATSMIAPGAPDRQKGGEVHICFADGREGEEQPPEERGVYSVAEHLQPQADEVSAESALIADIVLSEVGKTRLDPVSGEVRNTFGDIVVLVRNKQSGGGRIIAELVRRGIPVAADAEVNVCDYPEVKALISVLQYLDNGAQDIPLAAALKSAMGGVTDEELAAVRLRAGQKVPFYVACEQYAEREKDALAEKLRAFFGLAARLRTQMQAKGAAEILSYVLSETGMELKLLASPCGAEKVRRTARLVAECGELSVPEFLARLRSGGYDVGFSESGGEGAVRVMTMHASKGLEFPVVIVAGMSGLFSNKAFTGVLQDGEWGFAPLAYDLSSRTVRETLVRAAVRERIRRRRAEDEMRLLYVAFTRAKSALYLTFARQTKFSPDKVGSASGFYDFIDLSRFEDLFYPVFGAELAPPEERVLTAGEEDAAARAEVLSRYRRPYPFAESLSLPVKTSPSALLRAAAEAREEEEERTAGEFYGSAADAAAGTAYHAFLERADFSADPDAEAARIAPLLEEEGHVPIDRAAAARILRMPVFSSLKGYTLFREREFLLCAPAREVLATAAEDEILVQGVIDLLAVKGEECVIVDYKYSSHDAARLAADYAPQLKIYAAAARRIAGVKRVRAYIVNILRGFETEVPSA